MIIESGIGNGKMAAVTKGNQLMTRAISSAMLFGASEDGRGFMGSTNFMTLTTTGTEHGVMYITPTLETHLHSLRLCSTDNVKWRIYSGVTAGTLVTAGTDVDMTNLNTGSGSLFQGTVHKGSNGSTITDGNFTSCGVGGVYGGLIFELEEAFIMAPNSSIAISAEIVNNPTDVSVTAVLHHHEDDI